MQLNVKLSGYENLTVELNEQGEIEAYNLQGSETTLKLFERLLQSFGKKLSTWLIDGKDGIKGSHAELRSMLLIQELVWQSMGRSKLLYANEVVCTCRDIRCEAIDQAIIAGAHSVDLVSTWTTACTSCTSCKPKIERLLEYRLDTLTKSSSQVSPKTAS